MKQWILSRIAMIATIILLFSSVGCLFSEAYSIQDVSLQLFHSPNGQILFAPMSSGTTYLIESDGTVNHTWSSLYLPGESVWWMGDGTILRTIKTGVGPGSGGVGGGVQKVEWDGTVVWDFRYDSNGVLCHHDVKSLPNGNALLIAWETKTRGEAITAGRNPEYVSNLGFMPDHIIEVQPTGPSSGEIVWEWHVWDHLIQDYDPDKDNYGVVADHPELVDINYANDLMYMVDWLHTNSIDYNEDFDQILLSVKNFNEIWVIDHSTTTEEAAGHSGGNSGKGGDLLYRWGNPETYRAGTSNDQKFFGQHDATWIKSGCPGAGHLLVFNNGYNRPGGEYSSVEEIIPPVNSEGEYYLEPGSAYGPTEQTWIYTANPPTSFYAGRLCGCQRLPNGNTLICDGMIGRFFEITPTGTTIWEYTNPYPTPFTNRVFKIVFLPYEEPPPPEEPDLDGSGSLSWTDVKPGDTVEGSFQVRNIGGNTSLLNWIINTSLLSWGTWSFVPESGENLTPQQGPITVTVSVVAPEKKNTDFEGYVRVENQQDSNDFALIPVSLSTPAEVDTGEWPILHHIFLQFLQRHPFIETLWTLFQQRNPLHLD